MSVNIIAAIDLNRGLGYQNQLLCKLPNDMKHFKSLTKSNYVVMGRKTYESIGHPLPQRYNIILSRDKDYPEPKGTFVYSNLQDVIHEYHSYNNDEQELFIIGGSEIYHQALPYADRMYLTVIDHEFPFVDSFFPTFSMKDWKPVGNVENKADENNLYDHFFITYEKRN
jgi:dihydrofolate reductase